MKSMQLNSTQLTHKSLAKLASGMKLIRMSLRFRIGCFPSVVKFILFAWLLFHSQFIHFHYFYQVNSMMFVWNDRGGGLCRLSLLDFLNLVDHQLIYMIEFSLNLNCQKMYFKNVCNLIIIWKSSDQSHYQNYIIFQFIMVYLIEFLI